MCVFPGLFGLVFGLFGMVAYDGERVKESGMFQGYNTVTCSVVALQVTLTSSLVCVCACVFLCVCECACLFVVQELPAVFSPPKVFLNNFATMQDTLTKLVKLEDGRGLSK